MNKPKHIIAGLALTALTLTGCAKDLKRDKNGNIVTVKIDGNSIKITAGEMFDDYLTTTLGLKDYYDAVYQAVVRVLFEREDQKSERTEIYDYAALKVKEVKSNAKDNAKTGGSYDDELETLLESYNVETVKELEEKFAYEKMQEKLKSQFFDGGDGAWIQDAMEQLIVGERDTNGDLILDENGNPVYEGYLTNKLPYHVRHLLVNVEAENNSLVNAKISKDDANRLSSVITALASEQDTFGILANRFSEDSSSAAKFGDLGIMSTSTNFVNEFKLGVYTYDAIYNQDASLTANDRTKLNIPSDAVASLDSLGLGEIPYGAAIKLMEVRNYEKDVNGKEVNDGDTLYYPRNIMFNKYFNKHNISVITPNDVNELDEVGTENATYAAMPGFKAVAELGGKKVLTDEKGNVILVVRAGSSGSYEGVHFIVVERSAIKDVENGVSLKDYYTIETPETEDFPKDPITGEDLDTFVNFLKLDASGTKERIETIRSEVKTFDSNIDDRIFNLLVEKLNVEFSDAKLQEALNVYLDNQYAASQYTEEKSLVKQWEEWVRFLDYQQAERADRLVPESYITDFRAGIDFDWSSI